MDHITGFDPSPLCHDILHRKFSDNPKVTIIKTGLWSEECEMDLHNEGSQGGTIHPDYQTTCNPEHRITPCKFVKASKWFDENISEDDEVFLKLNCEGSECDIVNDLISEGQYCKIKATFIDFDVRKSPSQRHKERELIKRMQVLGLKNLHTYMGSNRYIILSSVICKGRK